MTGGTLNDPLFLVGVQGLFVGVDLTFTKKPGDLFALLKTNSCDPENRPGPQRK